MQKIMQQNKFDGLITEMIKLLQSLKKIIKNKRMNEIKNEN